MKIKTAVVGSGYWGKNLVRNFSNIGALYAVCDSNIGNLDINLPPDIKKYKSYDELLKDPVVDAVVIATPAELHFTMAKEALLNKKHVFVEKPLCLSEKEGIELNSIAFNNRVLLMVGHLLQYHPGIVKLKELISNGELGKIQYIYSNRLNLGKIRREENILWSFAPHDISIILSLTGILPEQVCTNGGNYLHDHIADVTMSCLSFANGIKAHIFVSWLHPFKEQKLIVVGNKGMAVFNDLAAHDEKLLVFPHKINWKEGYIPVPVKENAIPVPFENKEPLQEECRHFIKCIEEKKRAKTDGEEALRVLKVLIVLQQSLENQGKVIKLGKLSSSTEKDKEYFIHETAIADDQTEIGKGTKIWHFSHILKNSKIGKNCKIGQNVVIGPKVVIGEGVKIQNNVSVYEGVILEDFVFCGPSMVFTNVFNPRSEIPRMSELKKTLVKKGATIGANATIICGTTIGRYSLIGAGAVVTKDVADYAIVKGNPARQSGWICRCGIKLTLENNQAKCESCKAEYSLAGEALRERLKSEP